MDKVDINVKLQNITDVHLRYFLRKEKKNLL